MKFTVLFLFVFSLIVSEHAVLSTSRNAELVAKYDTDSSGTLDHEEMETLLKRLRLSHGHEEEHEEGEHEDDETCKTADGLVEHYDGNADSALSSTEIDETATDLILQLIDECPKEECSSTSTAVRWSMSLVSVLLISMAPIIITACCFPLLKIKWLSTFVLAFAVGTLVGEVLLHIVPHTFASHEHSVALPDPDEEDEREGLWYGCTMALGFMAFFVFEEIFNIVMNSVNKCINGPSQTKGELNSDSNGDSKSSDTGKDVESVDVIKANNKVAVDESVKSSPTPAKKVFRLIKQQLLLDPAHLRSSAFLISIVDAIHNTTDGIALGAAWSVSWTLGLATTLAVFIHEVPQEVSDVAAFVRSGVSFFWAIMINVFCALTAFLGVIIGVAASDAFEDGSKYLLLLSGGGFLYVATAHILSTVLQTQLNGFHRLSHCFAATMGFTVMLVIGLLEPHSDC